MTVTHPPSIQRWLQDHCESSAQVQGGLVVAAGVGAAPAQTLAEWPAGGGMTAPLAAAAQAALARKRPVVVAPSVAAADAKHNRVISLPLMQGDASLGAVALAVHADSGEDLDVLIKSLQRASQGVGDGLRMPVPVAADENGGACHDAALVLHLQDLFLRHDSLAEGALALSSELAPLLGCERVAFAAQQGTQLRLLALSNSSEFKSQQDLVRLMTAALQEAVDQGARVVYPAPATAPARLVLAHAELHQRTGQAVASVALVHARQSHGALMAEWRGSVQPTAAQLDLLDSVACVLAPLVALRQQAETTWAQRSKALLRQPRKAGARKFDPLPKLLALAAAAVVLGLCVWPVDFRVGAAARIESAVQRVVAAPMDGFLSKSHVRPGDSVKAGDVLLEMADQDLVLEQRKQEAALAQHENSFAAALARADRAQFVISQGKASEASAQLDLLRQQLARTKLVAPIDGVVIKGDLSQNLGAPVQRGDALLTLAPAEQYRLIVEVDERDVAHIRPGQKGQLALAASPAEPLAFVVERVTPVSAVREGRNVFEVQARFQASSQTTMQANLQAGNTALRPGLQGVAKIEAGAASAAWIWGHRAMDWLRLALWSWGP